MLEYRVGIICPVPREYDICKEKLALADETIACGRKLSRAVKDGISVAAVSAGLGKIGCAAATQYLISGLKCDIIIDSGSAGAIAGGLGIGDIVFSTEVYEYDIFPVEKFNKLKKLLTSVTEMDNILKNEYTAGAFREFCLLAKDTLGCPVHTAKCASGEKDVNSKKLRETLENSYKCSICNWETSAVIKTANLCGVKSFSIRSVSDKADEDMMKDYKKNASGTLEKLYEAVALFIYGGWLKKVFLDLTYKKK